MAVLAHVLELQGLLAASSAAKDRRLGRDVLGRDVLEAYFLNE